jgi:hypothetical protein
VISRPARIDFARREDDLQTVRDAVMRYEYENGALPESLDILVPRYLRRSQLISKGESLYLYNPKGRTVAMVEGAIIQGVVSRKWRPVEFVMPPLPPRARPKPHAEPKPEKEPPAEPPKEPEPVPGPAPEPERTEEPVSASPARTAAVALTVPGAGRSVRTRGRAGAPASSARRA